MHEIENDLKILESNDFFVPIGYKIFLFMPIKILNMLKLFLK
jgi:hypothetical protein